MTCLSIVLLLTEIQHSDGLRSFCNVKDPAVSGSGVLGSNVYPGMLGGNFTHERISPKFGDKFRDVNYTANCRHKEKLPLIATFSV